MSDAIGLNRGTPHELLAAGGQLALKGDIWDDLSVQNIVQKILDLFGLDIPNWESVLAAFGLEDLQAAIEGTYTGDNPALLAIQAAIGLIRSLVGGVQTAVNQIGDIVNGLIVTPINNAVINFRNWWNNLVGWQGTTTTAVSTADTKATNAQTAAGDASTAAGAASALAGAAQTAAGTAQNLANAAQTAVNQFVDYVWQGASNAIGGGTGKTQSEARSALLTLFGISNDAQTKAIDAQTKLQQLLAQEEANNSGGNSGSDDFNRSNSTLLGPLWLTINGSNPSTYLGVKSNAAATTVGGSSIARNYAVWNGPDQPTGDYHQATTIFSGSFDTFGSNYIGIIVRWDGQVAESGYPNYGVVFMIGQGGAGNYSFKLYRFNAGVRTEIASVSGLSIGGSDIIQLRAGSLADERNFQVFQNGTAVLGYTDSADATAMGPAYRKVGFVLVNDYWGFAMRGTAAINSFSWSDIPSPADVVGKFIKMYRSNVANVTMTANAQLPAGTFDTKISPATYDPLIIDLGRGVFRVPETGLWKFELVMAGTTESIAANAGLRPQGRLYYGGSSLEFNRQMTGIHLARGNTAGTIATPPIFMTCTQYLQAGQYVAPGWSAEHIVTCSGDGAGDRMSFTGYKVAA